MCAIYKSTLWHDADAMKACSANDNLNANVSMGEDEMQAFGRIDVVVKAVWEKGMTIGHTVPSCLGQSSSGWPGDFHTRRLEETDRFSCCAA